MDSWLDRVMVKGLTALDDRTSRRSALRRVGSLMLKAVGVAVALPHVPISRAYAGGSTCTCSPWFLCGMNGTLCCDIQTCGATCYGGCPFGLSGSYTGWTGCCTNPTDNTRHTVTYYDCCDYDCTYQNACISCPYCEPTNGYHSGVDWCDSAACYVCSLAVIGAAGSC